MKIEKYADADMMAIDVANILAGDLTAALQHQDRACLAVPGGTTPGPVFDVLCAADLDWSRVDVMLTDERWVAEDSPRSNTRLIRERLLVNRAAAATYLPLYDGTRPMEEALPLLSRAVEPSLPLAVVLLGMGADMHTASLFPGAPGLAEALAPDAPILVPMHPADQPEERVSLSARVLQGALRKHVIFKGADKKAAFDAAQSLPLEEAPIRAVEQGVILHWTE